MSYASNDTSATDQQFRQQVRQACLIYASTVAAEGTSVTNHANRSALASNYARYGLEGSALDAVCRTCASDGTTLPGSTDATVLTRVTALWNLLSSGL